MRSPELLDCWAAKVFQLFVSGEIFPRDTALGGLKTALFLCAWLLILLSACNTDPKAAARRYVAKGNGYFARGQYKEASILYRRALARDLRSPQAWYRLGLVTPNWANCPTRARTSAEPWSWMRA
jgi:tetratricopeptide (TPR) repeat protein